MTLRTSGIVALLVVVVCALSSAAAQQSSSNAPAPSIAASHQATLKQYCVTCHNARVRTSGLAIDELDLTNVNHDKDAWEKVVRKLRVGAMPPNGARRPDVATSNALITWLEGELDRTGTSHPGRPTLRRLNRAEYANAIRDLLALDVDVRSGHGPTIAPKSRAGNRYFRCPMGYLHRA